MVVSEKLQALEPGRARALLSFVRGPVMFRTGKLCAFQILLGRTKIETTVRYLGVDVEDALMLAEGVEI